MNDARTVPVSAIHYQVLAGTGLAMLVPAQHWQSAFNTPSLFLGALGLWMILFPKPKIPLVFLLCLSVIQFFGHADLYRGFHSTPTIALFDPRIMMLAGGTLLFLGSQYRLIAIKVHVTPYDPRFPALKTSDDAGRPIAPLTRPTHVLTTEEIVRFVIAAALCVVLGQLGWRWLGRNWQVAPRVMQIATLVWIVVVGLFLGRGIVGYWRQVHSDPARARLYLQEVAWREARRDYGRIGRWIAWGKRKMTKSD